MPSVVQCVTRPSPSLRPVRRDRSPFELVRDGGGHERLRVRREIEERARLIPSLGHTRPGGVGTTPSIYVGFVQASDARIYDWTRTYNVASTSASAFWPLSRTDVLPATRGECPTNWKGELGANFWAWLQARDVGMRIEAVASALAIGFTLPVFDRDVSLTWAARGNFSAPTPWTRDTAGKFSFNWIVHASPTGDAAPDDVHSFTFLPGLDLVDAAPTVLAAPKAANQVFEYEMEVPRGVAARVHLGGSLMLVASASGRLSTIDVGGIGDNFQFEYGVCYVAVSK